MSANIDKCGVFHCSPLERAMLASIYKDDIVVGENIVPGTYDFSDRTHIKLQSADTVDPTAFFGAPAVHRYRTGTTATSWSEFQVVFKDELLLTPGETYTISYWIKTSSLDSTQIGSVGTRYYIGNSWYSVTTKYKDGYNPTIVNEWQFKQGTFTVPSDADWVYWFYTIARDIDCYISHIKVEKGSEATPWCPAISDNLGDIPPTITNPVSGNTFYEY